jgi:hypothetical protein
MPCDTCVFVVTHLGGEMHQTDATLAAAELSKNKKPQNEALHFALRSQPYELKLNQRRWVGFKSCRLLAASASS